MCLIALIQKILFTKSQANYSLPSPQWMQRTAAYSPFCNSLQKGKKSLHHRSLPFFPLSNSNQLPQLLLPGPVFRTRAFTTLVLPLQPGSAVANTWHRIILSYNLLSLTFLPINQNDTYLYTRVFHCWSLVVICHASYRAPCCLTSHLLFRISALNFPSLNAVFALAFIEFHHIDFGPFFQFIKIILNIIMSWKVPCPPRGASLFCNLSC